MAIITLTSDLGGKDSYLASVKGSIYRQLESAKIVDITHNITPFDIQEAAYVLRNCFKDFPHGTIHIISIDDELTSKNEHLAVKANGHYFIGTDNGLFSLLLNEMKAENSIINTFFCMELLTGFDSETIKKVTRTQVDVRF